MSNSLNNEKNKQKEWNPATIEKLGKEGSQVGLPHSIENVFYSDKKESLIGLSDVLKSKGYEIISLSYNKYEKDKNQWCLIIKIDMIPKLENINEMTDICVELSSNFNCDYDGWYTTIVN